METQIIELEKKYWQGMEDYDYEIIKKLTHFPCIIASKNGVQSVDEATFKKMFESGSGTKIKIMNFSKVETQVIAENCGIIAYLIEFGMPDSKQKPSLKCACTSTWVRENGSWSCVLHTESELAE